MTLLLTAATEVSDLVIDFIEARLTTGKTISLNWDRSWTERSKGHFVALYDGVCFGTKSAAGKIRKLKNMRVVNVGLYSESEGEGNFQITIEKMEFYDRNKSLVFANTFAAKVGVDAMQKLYDKFLAGSRR